MHIYLNKYIGFNSKQPLHLHYANCWGVCFVADDPKERQHLRKIFPETAPKLSHIKLRHNDGSHDEGANRLKGEMT